MKAVGQFLQAAARWLLLDGESGPYLPAALVVMLVCAFRGVQISWMTLVPALLMVLEAAQKRHLQAKADVADARAFTDAQVLEIKERLLALDMNHAANATAIAANADGLAAVKGALADAKEGRIPLSPGALGKR